MGYYKDIFTRAQESGVISATSSADISPQDERTLWRLAHQQEVALRRKHAKVNDKVWDEELGRWVTQGGE